MAFTDNQLLAIESDGSDILVSAAAGSGKTTVLVERIIQRILDEKDPLDIDRMLVLTFTKAAASQMKDKILEAIEKKMKEDPFNEHLAKQSVLIQNAQISTFHGFCQEIIRNHFYEIDADPQMRVADEGEIKLMQMDALAAVLESAYENGDDDFLRTVEAYCSGRSDKNLEDIILRVYNLAQAQPEPENYLNLCETSYDVNDEEALKNSAWFAEYFNSLKESAQEAVSLGHQMLRLCDENHGPAKYRPMFENDLNFALALAEAVDYDELSLFAKSYEKMKLASIGAKDGVDDELKERSKKLRENFYKIIDNIKKSAMTALADEAKAMKNVAPAAKVIIMLVRKFGIKFAELKQDNGVIDFNDMEHMAIRILKGTDGTTAAEYRDKFVQIYVDEYQDSNLTQEEIIGLISRGNTGNGNVFMVGDVKQSIYRFRMARPDLFLKKYHGYNAISGGIADIEPNKSENGRRIDLSDNFRSRTEVLDSANEIFAAIMNRRLGGIEYDDAAKLHYGHLYDESISDISSYKAELMLASGGEEMSKPEVEATAIATRIKQLVGTMEIVDDETRELRKLRYSDIVILLRGMNGRDNVYRNVLTSMGIPSYVTTGSGYFSAREIETLLNLLAIIDNPLQDIPLSTVLRSIIGGFTDDDLALLRSAFPEKNLYYSLIKLADEAACGVAVDMTELKNKAKLFLHMLEHLRAKSEYMSVYEMLREVIDDGYGDLCRSGQNGNQAEANLNMLLKKAEDFGKLSYKGLFHFLRYIDQIRKYEIDYGEAGITDESDDNVRIMTIHKSKGLEFPVVFVSALSKSRNTSDERADIITDPDLGLGLNYVDTDNRIKYPTLLRECMSSRIKRENLAEEIRVLYVALTRAKEKLIMVAYSEDADKDFYSKNKPLMMCDSYLDMLSYAYQKYGKFISTHVIEMGEADYIESEVARQLSGEDALERLKMLAGIDRDKGTVECATEITRVIEHKLAHVYSHEDETAPYSKVSVSELKKPSMHEALEHENMFNGPIEEDGGDLYVPDFIREEQGPPNAGTFYGTAFHRMAELWDYSLSYGREDDITEEEIGLYFDRMCETGRIDRIQLESVRPKELKTFLQSESGRRMAQADSMGQLFREQPFTIGLEPGPMLVQGIIDAYWIEDGKIVILDYKTDRVNSGDQLVDRYKVQLDYYEEALSQLLDIPVKEKIIYSTRLREAVLL